METDTKPNYELKGEVELLPCPLRHEPKYLIDGRLRPERGVVAKTTGQLTENATIGGGYVRCLDCGLAIQAHNTRDRNNNIVYATSADAIKLWNSRASAPQGDVEAALAELREMFPNEHVSIEHERRDFVDSEGCIKNAEVSYNIYYRSMELGNGTTIEEAMTRVRLWKESNHK